MKPFPKIVPIGLVLAWFGATPDIRAASARDAAAIALGVSLVTPAATAALVRSQVTVEIEAYVGPDGQDVTLNNGTPLFRLMRLPAVTQFNAVELRAKVREWLPPLKAGSAGLKEQVERWVALQSDSRFASTPLTIEAIAQLLRSRIADIDRLIAAAEEFARVYDDASRANGLDPDALGSLTEIAQKITGLAEVVRQGYPSEFVAHAVSFIWTALNTGLTPPSPAGSRPDEQLRNFLLQDVPDQLNRMLRAEREEVQAMAEAAIATETEAAEDKTAKDRALESARAAKEAVDQEMLAAEARHRQAEEALNAAAAESRPEAEANRNAAKTALDAAQAKQTEAQSQLTAAESAATNAGKALDDAKAARAAAESLAKEDIPPESRERALNVAAAMTALGFPMNATKVFELQRSPSVAARAKLLLQVDPMTQVVEIAKSIELSFNSYWSGANFGPLANEAIQSMFANDPRIRHALRDENKGHWRPVNFVRTKGQAGDHNLVIYFENPLTPVLKSAKFDPTQFQLAAASAYEKAFSAAANLYGLPANAAAAESGDISPYNLAAQGMQRQQLAVDRTAWREIQLDALKQILDAYATIRATHIDSSGAAPTWKEAPSAEAARTAAIEKAKSTLTEIATSLSSP